MKGKVWVNPAGKNAALVDVFSVGLVSCEHFSRVSPGCAGPADAD